MSFSSVSIDPSLFRGKKLLLAFSAGIDSSVLLDVCVRHGWDVCIAHAHFGLRGEAADLDALFSLRVSYLHKINCHIHHFATAEYAVQHSLSTQMAARELRYQWFERLRLKHEYDYILTAHHVDDSVETFLIHLFRGTGVNGLRGIPEHNHSSHIVRPLLSWTRNQILEYAHQHGIEWREDATNHTDAYLRNRVRHHVVPAIQQVWPDYPKGFSKTIDHISDQARIIHTFISTLRSTLIFSYRDTDFEYMWIKPLLRDYSSEVLREILLPYGSFDKHELRRLVEGETGKGLHSHTHSLVRDRDRLWIHSLDIDAIHSPVCDLVPPFQLDTPIVLRARYIDRSEISSASLSQVPPTVIHVDTARVRPPFTLRKPQADDRFSPHGMVGTQKISTFFKNQKINYADRRAVWVLSDAEQIIWIVGYRMDDYFKITSGTQRVLRIELK